MDEIKNDKRIRGKEAMTALSGRLVQIKAIRWKFTVIALIANIVIYFVLLAVFKGDFDKTVRVYTNSFQYQAVGYVAWFMFPYFLRMEAKQDVGMAMAHDTVDLMDKIDEALATRLQRVDEILTMAKKSFDQVEKGSHPLLTDLKKYATEELEKLRQEIRVQKASAEQELSSALDEGEREAVELSVSEKLRTIHEEAVAEVAIGNGHPELEAQTSRCARCGCLAPHCTCGSLTH
jgi:hypothetical protein